MDGPDINSPFAQALIAEGVKRGYTPFDIAGSIGNAYQENKLNTTGVPGDNGTAFGGMQWRKSRFDDLKAEAQRQGKDWTDPAVQASHWFNEQDAAGNKGATDIDTANKQVIGSLAPRGYKPGQEQNAYGFTNRLTASQQALAAMNGAQGPLDPDAPAPGAQNASGVGDPSQTGGVLNQSQVPQYEPTLGDKLDRLSAAFLRRDSPGAAAQIDNSLQAKINAQQTMLKAQQSSNAWSASGKPVTGTDGVTRQPFVNNNGQRKSTVVPANEVEAPDDSKEKPSIGVIKQFQQNQTTLRNYGDLVDDINKFQDLVSKNDLKMSVLPSGLAEFKNSMGAADPDSAAIKEAQRLQNRIKFEYLKQEPGATTKQKIQQAGDIMFPAGSQFSTPTYLKSIEDAKATLKNGFMAMSDSNAATAGTFKGLPDGYTLPNGKKVSSDEFGKSYTDRWNDWDEKSGPNIRAYIDGKLGQRPAASSDPTKPKSIFDFLPSK